MRRAWLLVPVVMMLGCSNIINMAGTVVRAVPTQAQSAQVETTLQNSENNPGSMQMVLGALTSMVSEILRNRAAFRAGVAATLLELNLGTVLRDQGNEAALALLCSAPAPDDLPPWGVTVSLPPGDSAEEVGAETQPAAPEETTENPDQPLPEDLDGTTAALVVSGLVTDEEHPVSLEILVGEEETLQVRLRGGGWLLCALFDADLQVGDVLWNLPPDEERQPTLNVSAWNPTEGEISEDATPQDLLGPVEVVFTVPLPREAVGELLSAEGLIFWVGETPIELDPLDSEPVQRFRRYLMGEE